MRAATTARESVERCRAGATRSPRRARAFGPRSDRRSRARRRVTSRELARYCSSTAARIMRGAHISHVPRTPAQTGCGSRARRRVRPARRLRATVATSRDRVSRRRTCSRRPPIAARRVSAHRAAASGYSTRALRTSCGSRLLIWTRHVAVSRPRSAARSVSAATRRVAGERHRRAKTGPARSSVVRRGRTASGPTRSRCSAARLVHRHAGRARRRASPPATARDRAGDRIANTTDYTAEDGAQVSVDARRPRIPTGSTRTTSR